jgi:endogenous inhibitor of DNA gyrase (YacG/DUF329 family)
MKMIVEGQKAIVKWSNRNKTRFLLLGYSNFENGKEFECNIEDLTSGSHALILLTCDFCGEKFKKEYANIQNTKNHFCSNKCKDSYLIGKPSWNSKKIFVNCGYCNKKIERSEWELKDHKHLFCDRKCADKFLKEFGEGRPKVERFKINCDQCGLEIERTQSEIDRAENHFCTKECADKYMKGKINYNNRKGHEVKCYNCKIDFYFPKYRIESQERYFCSQECRKVWLKSEEFSILISQIERTKIDRIQVECSECGEIVEKFPSELRGELHFCSNDCRGSYFLKHNPNPTKEKIKVYCYTCGKEKLVHQSIYNLNKFFFCSHDCYQQKRMEISDFKFTGTSIHLKIDDLLDELGIKYKNEEGFGYYSMDIFLPEYSLGIEIMGDYWHGNPNKYADISELNEIQLKNISKDRRKNTFINKKFNTKILYLWEYDINKRLDVCEELIKDFISNKGKLNNYHSFNYLINDSNLILKNNIMSPFLII